ncbi:hypothetical protein DW322_08845 [Rhodococcus rhodnii]|uniref:Uncharacterized protein n=2 Tax=Rhodococcus rhodnii TaxID=38312 RepID=R7WRF4_9NOCA|nr:hypothetical protein [Rhodococcus rhodnii]EOM77903.1 hypothetical protein Rrhod_0712 [Rhodococcus rhodnii LMG 5362]TXG90312.1 hypothetical protein DW322_08845 [Rhodococcus rhodnii]
MAYEPKVWADGESGDTPITADELNRIEQGIASASAPVDYDDLVNRPSIPAVPAKLSAADARAGSSTAQRTIDAATLKVAIEEHAPGALAALEARVASLEAASGG